MYDEERPGSWSHFSHGIATAPLQRECGATSCWHRRHRRFSNDDTWDKIHARLLAEADAAGHIDWMVSADSSVNRAHQHPTNASKVTLPTGGSRAARSARASARMGRTGLTGG